MPEEAGDAGVLDTAAVMDFFASNGEASDPAPDPVVDPAPDAAPQVEQTPTADLLGPVPDLSDLDPAAAAIVQKRISEFQSGFTRRTTELADANRVLEAAGGNPEALLEAYNFQQSLLDDGPEGDDARARLYQALNSQYGQQPAATEPAPPAVQEDPFSEYDLPDEIRNVLSMVPQLQARLDAQDADREAQSQELAHQQYVQEVYEDLVGKMNEVTKEFPDLGDAQDEIIDLSYSTNGNILGAVDKYRAIESRIMAKLIEGSVNVPGGLAAPPAGGGHSTEPPVEFTDFKSLRGAVTEYLERASAEIE